MARTEHETRGQLIDRQLERAGWRIDDRTQVRREVPADTAVRESPPPEYGSPGTGGITDDCLYDDDGCVLSGVGCKRTARDGDGYLKKPRICIERRTPTQSQHPPA